MDREFRADVERHADALGYDLDPAELTRFAESLESLTEVLDSLETVAPERSVRRDSWSPDESADPNGAFLRRCDVRDDADGPLAGTRVAVKDNLAVAGVEMTCGSPALSGYRPVEDATVVARLLDAGARIVGKANLDEFAYARQPNSTPFRVPRNPSDPAYQPGSSSSGSAIAVADDLADVALGSDNGGSTRIPAAWCGVVGLKPTSGLISHAGLVLSAKSLDTVGVLAQSPGAVARALAAVAGVDPRDDLTRGARVREYGTAVDEGRETDPDDLVIGIPEAFVGTAPSRDAVARAALDDLADAGATVRSVEIDDISLANAAYRAINVTETGNYVRSLASTYWRWTVPDPTLPAELQAVSTDRPDSLPERLRYLAVAAGYLRDRGNRQYALGQRARHRVAAGLDGAFEQCDLLASVTVAADPQKVGADLPRTVATNTLAANVGGHPAITVPCGTLDGLPVGLQFVAPRFSEDRLLRGAAHWASIRNDTGSGPDGDD